MNIEDMAKLARAGLETRTRDNGETFWARKGDAPEWLGDLCFAAHGDLMPDDWRYAFIVDALDIIATGDEDAEPEADIYTHDLLAWLASNSTRVAYCDDALSDGASDLVAAVSAGQWAERSEVLDHVRCWLSLNCDDIE